MNLSNELADDVISKFNNGIKLQGLQHLIAPAILQVNSSKEVLLTITEGKFHQVKRMFAAVGNRILSLHPVKVGNISLDVEVGQWRYLTNHEVASFTK